MLITLLAAGALDSGNVAGSGPLIAAPEAIALIPRLPADTNVGTGIPLGAPKWQLALDPNDQAPYAWDFSGLLGVGVNIASVVSITMSAAGAAVGVEIASGSPVGPVITIDGQHVQVWFMVDPTQLAALAFVGAGLQVAVSAAIKTDQASPREYERTAVLTVRQL